MEKLLGQCQIPVPMSSGDEIEFSASKWVKGKNFCRKFDVKVKVPLVKGGHVMVVLILLLRAGR